MCSTDGGLTFIPCPVVIMGEENIFVTYDVTFTDGCPPIHIEQSIHCVKSKPCENNRLISIANTANTLVVTLTDTFESGILSDKLYVSIDNGATFVEFSPPSTYVPITLVGNEKIVVYTNTIFDDGCSDLTVTKKLDLVNNTGQGCIGYGGYGLTVSYDENTGLYTVTKTGSESTLVINDLLWAIGGANPFDANNSGVPYANPVQGEGLFIARWKIKLPSCPEIILDAMAFGQPCVKFCDDINLVIPPVQVLFPQTPIEVCLVSCCDGVVLTIECVDMVLTVTGAPAGSTITWTGPNGFTATGASTPITDEGTYIVTVVDNTANPPCTSTAVYNFVMPDAGEPIANPVLVD
jgi:hypothetical protein